MHPFLDAPKNPNQKPREVAPVPKAPLPHLPLRSDAPIREGMGAQRHAQVRGLTSRWRQIKPPKCRRWGSLDGYTHRPRVKTPERPGQAGLLEEMVVRRDGAEATPRGTGFILSPEASSPPTGI